MTHNHATVIGGGIGGLASAILLRQAGYEVDLYEKNNQLGGRARILTKDGFRRDMGPSWYLMPDLFRRFFDAIGESIDDHLTLTQLSPQYRIFFGEDTHDHAHTPHFTDITGDLSIDIQTLEQLEPGVTDKFVDYLHRSQEQYDLGMGFIQRNYDSIRDYMRREIMKTGRTIPLFQTFTRYVRKYFSSSKVQKIIQYPLVFLGTNPNDAPALYNIMTHVDFNLGLFYPDGGIRSIIDALIKIGTNRGVRYHTDSPVDRLVVDEQTRRTSGVVIHGTTYPTDHVICNAEMAWAETTLLTPQQQSYPASYRHKRTFAPSAFLLYLGLDQTADHLLHHNLIFSEDWHANFGAIFDTKTLPDDPSLYICCPSKTDPTVVPPERSDSENMFVLVPIPNGISINDTQADEYEHAIYDLIRRTCHTDIPAHTISRTRYMVDDFRTDYNAREGTALGLAHTLRQTALMRPNNISKKLSNLYYVGHNTVPGIGMPMVLISAMLMYHRLTGEYLSYTQS